MNAPAQDKRDALSLAAIERSGSPGYRNGLPVVAGLMQTNATAAATLGGAKALPRTPPPLPHCPRHNHPSRLDRRLPPFDNRLTPFDRCGCGAR